MPTIILLDVSLSMSQPVPMTDTADEYRRRHLAIHGIHTLLDYLSANAKLEFVSLVIFSSLYEQVVPFTRDYNEIRTALSKLEEYNSTSLENALLGVNSIVMEEWGVSTLCHIILITDAKCSFGDLTLKRSIQNFRADQMSRPGDDFPLPFSFPSSLYIMCICSPLERSFQTSKSMYQNLVDINNRGQVFWPQKQLNMKAVEEMFTELCNKYYVTYTSSLQCGHLSCHVQLFPSPDVPEMYSSSTVIEVCGFIEISEIGSPAYVSRHLVFPIASKPETAASGTEKADTEESSEKTAAFTVLLHGSLKIEGLVALVQLCENRFGMMYAWADNKKKSNLMLSIFQPGSDVIPWLGDLNHLTIGALLPNSDMTLAPPGLSTDKRSYAQNCVIWIRNASLQADVQKVLRTSRKLPDKQQLFYKELNRIRKAALALGFYELLLAIADLLDRECRLLPSNTHPAAALQMTHVASVLRSKAGRDVTQNISPLNTRFNTK